MLAEGPFEIKYTSIIIPSDYHIIHVEGEWVQYHGLFFEWKVQDQSYQLTDLVTEFWYARPSEADIGEQGGSIRRF